ncbi:hypothetical protein MWN33_17865 [Starkeya koreensis]|uniref:Uncharacterized protein n=1 Tax=Ancylobacter koreensis TaxID=266121 RepID=A0ABT0DRJ8_9HYPH|nr:hypothetical protein [Ancylobacter koreensis]MCK0209901.1 hypothetical protein [Ancylobacter koreensis]
MRSLREILLNMDIELEDYTSAIGQARNPMLSDDDRLMLLRSGEASWKRLEAAHRELAVRAAGLGRTPANDAKTTTPKAFAST